MDIKIDQNLLDISDELFAELKRVMIENVPSDTVTQFTFNYRDSSYNTEAGGYHPVEIAIQKEHSSNRWQLIYITDFAYQGYPYAELVKELDFDFTTELFCSCFSRPEAISHPDVKEMYQLWESNFLNYLELGAYDQITISAY
ncbi:DUF2787 domain-containing protein [Psychromonas sp.]|uniref:DUF2787 domain-containing protein n=1 Tax=Psychromonas sp. TaxID=1884585 RepID=UPI0035684EA9